MSKDYHNKHLIPAYLAADAVVFSVGVFLCARAALLRFDDAAGMMHPLNVFMAFTAFLFVSRCANARFYPGRFFAGFALELATLFAAVFLPMRLAMSRFREIPFYRLPYLAARFPGDFSMFARDSVFPAIAVCALFLIAVHYISRMRGPRMFARTLLIIFIAIFVEAHYAGFLPVTSSKMFLRKPGVEKIYPARGAGAATVSPRLISDVLPCTARNAVWLAAGRARTLLLIGADGKILKEIKLKKLSPGRLAADQQRRDIYALDNEKKQIVIFSEDGAAPYASYPVRAGWGGEALDVLPLGNLFYVSYDGKPGLAEFDADKGIQTGGIQFLDPPAIAFRTGGWAFAALPRADSIFALAGAADAAGNAALVRVDLTRFRIAAMGILPDSGPALTVRTAEPAAYMTSFNRNKIYEIDLTQLKVVRTLPGPAGARAIAIDARRDILFAAGYYDGRLMAIDLKSGLAARSDYVGKRVTALKLDPAGKFLYIASAGGVFRINIAKYTGRN